MMTIAQARVATIMDELTDELAAAGWDSVVAPGTPIEEVREDVIRMLLLNGAVGDAAAIRAALLCWATDCDETVRPSEYDSSDPDNLLRAAVAYELGEYDCDDATQRDRAIAAIHAFCDSLAAADADAANVCQQQRGGNENVHYTLVDDPDTDGGQRSSRAIPREQARREEQRLTAEGHEASWAPDGDDPSMAWLYVRFAEPEQE